MEQQELIDKLKKAITSFIEKESYDSLKDSIGEHFFEDNKNVQWSNENDYFQIEFEVLDKWFDKEEVVFVVADATDGYQRIGAALIFPEKGTGFISQGIDKYVNGVPTRIGD